MADEAAGNRIGLTSIQRLIGRLMQQSKEQMPCGYMEVCADITELLDMRKPYCKEVGQRITTNDFYYCALSRAAVRYPLMTARLSKDGEDLRISPTVNIGFAVAAPQGLVVPVIKDTGGMTLADIAKHSDRLLKKARADNLSHRDFYDENIVLSGLGMYGVDSFYAIAPPGAVCIIAIGRILEKVVPIDGNFVARKMMNVAMSFNQRIVDEIYAAGFLRNVIDHIEAPRSLTV
jgi:pyruvate dehydrogenase E2 component (dihydrolipoamide acetyltransferase)